MLILYVMYINCAHSSSLAPFVYYLGLVSCPESILGYYRDMSLCTAWAAFGQCIEKNRGEELKKNPNILA
jgi:hypothetical protein